MQLLRMPDYDAEFQALSVLILAELRQPEHSLHLSSRRACSTNFQAGAAFPCFRGRLPRPAALPPNAPVQGELGAGIRRRCDVRSDDNVLVVFHAISDISRRAFQHLAV